MLKILLMIVAAILGIILFALCCVKFYFMYIERESRKRFETEGKLPKKKKRRNRAKEAYGDVRYSVAVVKPPEDKWAKDYLSSLRTQQQESFYSKLNRIMQAKSLDAIEIYKKADIDRRLFSKFKKEDYHPRKKTVLALAFAMELNVEETEDLLIFAGYAFTDNRDFDLIVKDCLQKKNYNLIEVNKLLYRCTKETL